MRRKHVIDDNNDSKEHTDPEQWFKERHAFYQRIYGAMDPTRLYTPDPAVSEVLWRMGYTIHMMSSATDDFLKPYNLTGAKFRLLLWLFACEKSDFQDGLLPSQLSKIQGITPNTVSSLLDGLQEQGLIERVRHPSDHRKRIVTITEA